MEQRLSLITLLVDDVDEARKFFVDGLGWTCAEGPETEIAFFQIGSMALACYARSALEAELGSPVAKNPPGTIAIAWNGRSPAEVDAACALAVKAGARVLKAPHETHWGGYSCYLEILGGHMLELAHNPFWTIAEDGSISLSG